MKKIRLHLDALEVESFGVAAEPKEVRGTVHGHTGANTCYGRTCDIYNPCADTRYPYC